jgi:hypothetical protein
MAAHGCVLVAEHTSEMVGGTRNNNDFDCANYYFDCADYYFDYYDKFDDYDKFDCAYYDDDCAYYDDIYHDDNDNVA